MGIKWSGSIPWKKWRRRIPPAIPILGGVAVAMVTVLLVELACRPLLLDLASVKAEQYVTALVNQVVADHVSQLDGILEVQQGSDGGISAITTDTIALNALRADIVADVLEEIQEIDGTDLGIPIGSLTGIAILSGRGPEIPIYILTVASAEGVFSHDFLEAGINQTLHRMMLEVTVVLSLRGLGEGVTLQVETPVCVAETVIVGDVPQVYVN